MSTTKEYWLLCEDYGSYEGGIDPIGLFETEESAKEWVVMDAAQNMVLM